MSQFANENLNLRVMGFCGADDSVDPSLLHVLSTKYPWIEWGVLFRPDLEGTPRYASMNWVNELSKVNKDNGNTMKLAAHLCKSRCQEVLDGDSSFVQHLSSLGFSRAQVNATTANGVDMDPAKFDSYSVNLKAVIESVPQVEWIIQLNDETRPLWNLLSVNPPRNMSVLYDASCGKGVVPSSFPPPPSNPDIPCGYAGGIGPDNVAEILTMVGQAAGGKPVWIDMESSLRVAVSDKFVSDQDQFSINKCFACIKVGVQFGMPVTRIALMSI